MDAIKTENLSKTFDALTAVDNLTLSVAPGELFGLVGSDGAGKTTTMRMLTSIMDPTSGDAWVMGRHVTREAEAIKEEIGYMSQRFGLYPDLTVQENILFYADIYGLPRKGREEKVDLLLAFSNLTPFRKRKAGNLSGGMKQKLGLACALVHTPKVLFLDEPTNGVDPLSRRDFWRILYQLLKEGTAIFLSTAYLDEADRCNRVGLIHKGKLLACAPPEDLKKLMHGIILEVRTAEPRRTARLLKERLGTDSVTLFGDKTHVATTEPDRTTAIIKETCKKEGLSPVEICEIEPSLEDVFVSVLTEKNRQDGSGR
jgi:ABC-2 type transport system ATP-binding protein